MSKSKASETDIVLLSRDGGVVVVTMNYPQRRNAFSLKMRQELYRKLYDMAYLDQHCRAIILNGANQVFCAGGDISEMKPRTVLEFRERNLLILNIFKILASGPKPVVAAVEGFAMGAGVSLSAACDYVVSSRAARYACSFIKLGLLPDCGIYWSLAQRVGRGAARELMMTGREFSGQEALHIGFANETTAPGETLAAAMAVAQRYASLPPLALTHLKAALGSGCETLDKAIETEINLQPLLRRSRDHREAAAAFLEKRKPVFVGE